MCEMSPELLDREISRVRGLLQQYAADLAAGVSMRTAADRAFEGELYIQDALRESGEIAARERRVPRDNGFYDVTLSVDPIKVLWTAYDSEGNEVSAETWEEAVLTFLRARIGADDPADSAREQVRIRLEDDDDPNRQEWRYWALLADLAALDDLPSGDEEARGVLLGQLEAIGDVAASATPDVSLYLRNALSRIQRYLAARPVDGREPSPGADGPA